MPDSRNILKLRDARADCDSVIFSIDAKQFIDFILEAYENKGGIQGQRGPVKTKSAISIRKRLVDDLSQGAIVPPITVGILADRETRSKIWECANSIELMEMLRKVDPNSLSIIDGMQRTTALIDASAENSEVGKREIRVEIWSSERIGGLVYRMLVLNSGQIPWETARQLETIYSQFISSIRSEVGGDVELFLKDDGRRRSAPGQFQASTVVRLYLAFSARRAEFDIKDRVAEDFARLDAIESSSHSEFFDFFRETFQLLLSLDHQFSRFRRTDIPYGQTRIRDGREVFKSEPALLGFFVSVSVALFDVPGFDIDWDDAPRKMSVIAQNVQSLAKKLNDLSEAELEEFLQLDILNERLDVRSGQVGRYERDLFSRAFSLLVARGDSLPNLKPCWLA